MSFKKAIAIDGNCLMYRCFYATFKQLPYYALHNIKPTNALNLFIHSVLKLITENKYDYAFIAFDHGKHTFRTDKYEKYKVGRKPMPNELFSQLEDIKSSVKLMGIYSYELDNYEADDLIGSYAKLMNSNNVSVDIYSSDRDMLQLINDLTCVKLLKTGVSIFDEYNSQNFKSKFFELNPCQITDFKGISGDSSDCLKGVEGIGPKTTVKLLLKYQTIDNLYQHLDELQDNLKQKLINFKQQVYDCKDLATIHNSLFNNENIDKFVLNPINFNALLNLTDKYHLNTLNKFIRKLKDN